MWSPQKLQKTFSTRIIPPSSSRFGEHEQKDASDPTATVYASFTLCVAEVVHGILWSFTLRDAAALQ